jgi:hypothetical protein
MHHPIPVFMGGNAGAGQFTQYVSQGLHSQFHTALNQNLVANGFPRGGGVGGGYGDWLAFFGANPGSQQQALNILQWTAGTFDLQNGTNFLQFVQYNLLRGNLIPR